MFVSFSWSQNDTLFVHGGALPVSIYSPSSHGELKRDFNGEYLWFEKDGWTGKMNWIPHVYIDDNYHALNKTSDSSAFEGVVKFTSDFTPTSRNEYCHIETTSLYREGVRFKSSSYCYAQYPSDNGDTTLFLRLVYNKDFDSTGLKTTNYLYRKLKKDGVRDFQTERVYSDSSEAYYVLSTSETINDTSEFFQYFKSNVIGYGCGIDYKYGTTNLGVDTIYRTYAQYMNGDLHGLWISTIRHPYGKVVGTVTMRMENEHLADVISKDILFVDKKFHFISKRDFFEALNSMPNPNKWGRYYIPLNTDLEYGTGGKVVFVLDEDHMQDILDKQYLKPRLIKRFYRKLARYNRT